MTYSQSFIDEHRDFNVDDVWWGAVYDDFKAICDILGIMLQDGEPSFSGFASQGDGASFAGVYRAVTYTTTTINHRYETAPDELRAYAGNDTQLHAIADELCTLNRVYTPMYVNISRPYGGRCVYAETMHATIDHFWCDDLGWTDTHDAEDGEPRWPPEVMQQIEDQLTDLFRRLADWLYRTLEKEYEYLTSDEAIIESLEANGIEEENDEGVCRTCGGPNDNGEGWDGECGDCADRTAAEEDGEDDVMRVA
jgi:hypothetical protein